MRIPEGGCVWESVRMSQQEAPAIRWGKVERQRFREARKAAGHGSAACAEVLREEFGVTTASQPNISRWESGATKRPECAPALLQYCDTYGIPEAAAPMSHMQPEREADRADGPERDAEAFHRLAGMAADQPLLGPLQTELVSSISQRLREGPPLSPEDRATYLDQLSILRLTGR